MFKYLNDILSIMQFHRDMTLEKFWVMWFGEFGDGREIGSDLPPKTYPNIDGFTLTHRTFSDNPDDLLKAIKWCEENKYAVWITAQPFSAYDTPMAIEKFFYDFDDDTRYCPECNDWYKREDEEHFKLEKDKETKKSILLCIKHNIEPILKPRKEVVKKSVIRFLNTLENSLKPVIVETNKGYHVYLFCERNLTFAPSSFEFSRKLYRYMMHKSLSGKSFEFLDEQTFEIKRLARVPLTIHEKWGERCLILTPILETNNLIVDLKEDKVRNISEYKINGVRVTDIERSIMELQTLEKNKLEMKLEEEQRAGDDILSTSTGFSGRIRPCFLHWQKSGVMSHIMRLAFLREIYHNKYTDVETMINFFRNFADFDENRTRYQVEYFLSHNPETFPPYKCGTIQARNWCIKKKCPKWCKERGKLYIEENPSFMEWLLNM